MGGIWSDCLLQGSVERSMYTILRRVPTIVISPQVSPTAQRRPPLVQSWHLPATQYTYT
jgi:hypothetical protein